MPNIFDICFLDPCYWEDTALPHNDVDSFPNVKDAVECQKHCQNNVECSYWTVSSKRVCFLKNQNAMSNHKVAPNFTSGPKNCGKYSICFRE